MHNSSCEKQSIVLMISKGEALSCRKKLALLRGGTSKHHGDFYCLNCLHSFVTDNKCESN